MKKGCTFLYSLFKKIYIEVILLKPCLHIYTGDGKGKTTAAVGLAARFISYGGPVLFLQFMKGAESGECASLRALGCEVCRLSKDFGFYPNLSDPALVYKEHTRMLSTALEFMQKENALLVLDESISAYALSLLDREEFLAILQNRKCEMVCTGRDVPPELLSLADYITEMKCIRHPYENGLSARCGVEF